MRSASPSDNSPFLSWTTLASVAGLLLVVLAGEWTVFETQITGVREQIKDHSEIEERAHQRFQAQLDRRFDEQEKILDRHTREQFTNQAFKLFSDDVFGQITTLRDQLKVLEQTRPTTGELTEVVRSTRENIAKIEGQLQEVQKYNLGQARPYQSPGR